MRITETRVWSFPSGRIEDLGVSSTRGIRVGTDVQVQQHHCQDLPASDSHSSPRHQRMIFFFFLIVPPHDVILGLPSLKYQLGFCQILKRRLSFVCFLCI